MQLAAARNGVPSPDPLSEGCGRRVLGDDPWVMEAARRGGCYGIKAYTAREWDPETNLYYYRARYYDPKVGRFISEDPIGFKGGANFYAYVFNRPCGLNDPMGLRGCKCPCESGEWTFQPLWGWTFGVGAGPWTQGGGVLHGTLQCVENPGLKRNAAMVCSLKHAFVYAAVGIGFEASLPDVVYGGIDCPEDLSAREFTLKVATFLWVSFSAPTDEALPRGMGVAKGLSAGVATLDCVIYPQ
jgi:RHS repeat-associated protein